MRSAGRMHMRATHKAGGIFEMKIWKSNLQGLLEEVTGPLYVIAACSNSMSKDEQLGQLEFATFYIAVAGFNSDGHVCELRVYRQAMPSMFTEDVNTEMQANK